MSSTSDRLQEKINSWKLAKNLRTGLYYSQNTDGTYSEDCLTPGSARDVAVSRGWLPTTSTVESLVISPTNDGIIVGVEGRDLVPNAPAIFMRSSDKVYVLNDWRPPALQPTPSDWPSIHKMVQWLAAHDPTMVEHMLNWCAALTQNPGQILPTTFLLQGIPGNGKTTLVRVLSEILGYNNVAFCTEDDFSKPFNSKWANKLLVYLNEADHDFKRTRNLMNDLKPVITDSRITVEPKGKDRYEIENKIKLIVSTNYSGKVLNLENGDRRVNVAKNMSSIHQDMPGGGRYVDLLVSMHVYGKNEKFTPAMYREIAGFAYDMMQRKVDFNMLRKPYENQARTDLREQSEGALELFVRELRESKKPHDWLHGLFEDNKTQDYALNIEFEIPKHPGAYSVSGLYSSFKRFCVAEGFARIPQTRHLTSALRSEGWADFRTDKLRGLRAPWPPRETNKSQDATNTPIVAPAPGVN